MSGVVMLRNLNINRYFLFAATSVSILAASVVIEPPAVTSSPVRVSQNNDNFRSGIRVCNYAEGSGTIYMAIGVLSNQGRRTRTVGWFSAEEGECRIIANRIDARNNYYLYAHGSDGLFWGGQNQLCVRHPQGFDISNAANTRNCGSTRGFYRLNTRNRSSLTEYLEGFDRN